jgi:hypothetical protein
MSYNKKIVQINRYWEAYLHEIPESILTTNDLKRQSSIALMKHAYYLGALAGIECAVRCAGTDDPPKALDQVRNDIYEALQIPHEFQLKNQRNSTKETN